MRTQRQPNPLGKLLGGESIIAISVAMGRALADPHDPVGAVASGFLMLCGAWVVASGLYDLLRRLSVRAARKKAERPTGVFGTASFANLQDCADAGLTDPYGLFLGALKGVPLFFNGKAHLVTVAPARQGKGTCVVITNLLHYPGSVFVTDPKGELAAVTSAHRRERFGHKINCTGTGAGSRCYECRYQRSKEDRNHRVALFHHAGICRPRYQDSSVARSLWKRGNRSRSAVQNVCR